MSKVYVLGAGAGAAYTGSYIGETSPVAKNFFQKAMQVIDVHQIQGRDFGDQELKFDHIFDFIEQLWGVPRGEVHKSDLDMEEVLTLLNIEMEEDKPGRNRLLQAYEEYLLLMALTFDKILYGKPCPNHSRIAKSLSPGDSVISFNYELLMDYALNNLKESGARWYIHDGYGIACEHLSSKDVLNPNRNRLEESAYVRTEKKSSNIKLFKLHGSLNWLYCPHCGQLYAYEHSDAKGHSIVIHGIANMIQCSTKKCCHRLSRVIIPPTLMKNYQSIPFIPRLWHEARKVIREATEIIVIGYSFPTTDFRSNWMFRKGMVDNRGLEKLTIVDTAEGYQLKNLLAKHKSIFRVDDLEYFKNIAEYTETLV